MKFFLLSLLLSLSFTIPAYSAGCDYANVGSCLAAAQKGDAEAEKLLGLMYINGQGVVKDYRQAAKWFVKSARKGNVSALYNLGVMYSKGDGLAKDYKKAMEMYKKAIEWNERSPKQGGACPYCNRHDNHQNRHDNHQKVNDVAWDYKQGARLHRKLTSQRDVSTEQSVANAQYNIGVMYNNGNGFAKDPETASLWFAKALVSIKKLAAQGDSVMQHTLGNMYKTGRVVKKNSRQAMEWFLKSAEQGNAGGQLSLGIMYYTGDGGRIDHREAVKWFLKSAEQGNVVAQQNLGMVYLYGSGVVKSFPQAYMWFNIATANESGAARIIRDKLEKKMTTSEIYQAQEMSKEWFSKNSK